MFFADCIRQLFRRRVSAKEFIGYLLVFLDLLTDRLTQVIKVAAELTIGLTANAHQQELNLFVLLDIPVNVYAEAKMIISLVRLQAPDQSCHPRQ